MKSIAAVLAALFVAVLGFGCADDDDDQSADGADQESYEIAFLTGPQSDPFHVALACGGKAGAAKYGVDLNLQSTKTFDPPEQVRLINSVAPTQPDAIVVAPGDKAAPVAALTQAKSAGATIVTIDVVLEDPDIAAAAITEDYLSGGRQAAQVISELVGGEGKVLLISGLPGISTQDNGKKGFEEGLAEEEGIEYLGTKFDQFDPTKTASIVTATLARDPDLAGIVTLNGPSADGVVNGLRREGKLGQVEYASFDATPTQVEQLREGHVERLLFWKPFQIGEEGVRQAVRALNGEKTTQLINTQPLVATKENIDDPEISKFLYKGC
jgi:ribose transport system substrate-binding protein